MRSTARSSAPSAPKFSAVPDQRRADPLQCLALPRCRPVGQFGHRDLRLAVRAHREKPTTRGLRNKLHEAGPVVAGTVTAGRGRRSVYTPTPRLECHRGTERQEKSLECSSGRRGLPARGGDADLQAGSAHCPRRWESTSSRRRTPPCRARAGSQDTGRTHQRAAGVHRGIAAGYLHAWSGWARCCCYRWHWPTLSSGLQSRHGAQINDVRSLAMQVSTLFAGVTAWLGVQLETRARSATLEEATAARKTGRIPCL